MYISTWQTLTRPFYIYIVKNIVYHSNGSLKRYVENRHSVMLYIQQELGIDLTLIKENVLKLLNKTCDNKLVKFSKTLMKLDEDFQTIRDHLWDFYCKGELDNYKQCINQSMKKKGLYIRRWYYK